jgi:mono/diheme cytochrome c family protein
MSTLIFVLVWVVLGLGLLLVAMSGGPGGALKGLMSQSRGSRKAAIVVFFLALVVLGIGVPAAVIAAVSSSDSVPEANVTNLTASEERGRELFGRRCAQCHELRAANAVAQVGPSLDASPKPKELVLQAIENGRSSGNGEMPANLYTGRDAEDVANFVAKASGATAQEQGGGGGQQGGRLIVAAAPTASSSGPALVWPDCADSLRGHVRTGC